MKIIENFDNTANDKKNDVANSFFPKSEIYDDSTSMITGQLKCLRKIDEENLGRETDEGKVNQKKDYKFNLKTNDEKKKKTFGSLSLIWLILPIINLILDTIYDLSAVIMYFFKKIFKEVYKAIVPTTKTLLGEESGVRSGKKYCLKYDWFRYVILVLCPPAAIFMANGLKAWFQILICCIASLFFYFPGLAYAIIVSNRSEVDAYMKSIYSPTVCNSDSNGSFSGLFVSDLDNVAECRQQVGETCVLDSKDPDECCANPKLINGQWKRNTRNGYVEAKDRGSNLITNAEQGAVYCRNDTEKITSAKGICVWKVSGKPN